MIENLNIALVFGAGLASVLSPCVLPVVPIVVTGSTDDHRLRPVMIVSGLAITFMAMGVISSLFGAIIGPKMVYVEKTAAVIIVLFGFLLLFNVNLFKHVSFISNIGSKTKGRVGGFILGLILGIIWIPCVGPMLSGVLALVATQGNIGMGIFLLFIYSLGFAVPMLIAGYASQFFRTRFRKIGKFPYVVNIVSGLLLVALGAGIFFRGMLGLGF
jgi:cytochrome c-type biogenesis protein